MRSQLALGARRRRGDVRHPARISGSLVKGPWGARDLPGLVATVAAAVNQARRRPPESGAVRAAILPPSMMDFGGTGRARAEEVRLKRAPDGPLRHGAARGGIMGGGFDSRRLHQRFSSQDAAFGPRPLLATVPAPFCRLLLSSGRPQRGQPARLARHQVGNVRLLVYWEVYQSHAADDGTNQRSVA